MKFLDISWMNLLQESRKMHNRLCKALGGLQESFGLYYYIVHLNQLPNKMDRVFQDLVPSSFLGKKKKKIILNNKSFLL